MKVTRSPVKILASELGLPVYQPERVRSAEVIEKIAEAGAECAAVVAFGQILPQRLLDRFPLGTLNVHGSLLPKYRGAAPIQRAILAGETETGISIMLLDAGMDTGPVLAKRAVPIEERDTFGTVHDKLAGLGADLLVEALADWKSGRIAPVAQSGEATYAPPIKKEEHRISWQSGAACIVNSIRAFDPLPGAYFIHGGKRVKCFDALLFPFSGAGAPGEVIGASRDGLVVLAGDGKAVAIGWMQLEGQRKLGASEFLRGRAIPSGAVLE